MNDLTISESYVYDTSTNTPRFGSPLDRSPGPDTPVIRSIVSRLDGLPRLPFQLSNKEISKIERDYNVDFSSIIAGRSLPFHRQPETRLAHSTPRPSFSGKLPIKEPLSPLDKRYTQDTGAAKSLHTNSAIHTAVAKDIVDSRNGTSSGVPLIGGQEEVLLTTEETAPYEINGKHSKMTLNDAEASESNKTLPLVAEKLVDEHPIGYESSQTPPNEYNELSPPVTRKDSEKLHDNQNYKKNGTNATREVQENGVPKNNLWGNNDSDKENYPYNTVKNLQSPPNFIKRLDCGLTYEGPASLIAEKSPKRKAPATNFDEALGNDPTDQGTSDRNGLVSQDRVEQVSSEIPRGAGSIHVASDIEQHITGRPDSTIKTEFVRDEMKRLQTENDNLRAKIDGLEAEIGDRSQMMVHDENSEWADAYLRLHLDSLDSYNKVDALNTIKKILLSLNIGTADNIPATMKLWGRVIFHTSRFLDKLHDLIHPCENVNPSDYTINPGAPENLPRFVQCLDNMITDVSCYRKMQIKMPLQIGNFDTETS